MLRQEGTKNQRHAGACLGRQGADSFLARGSSRIREYAREQRKVSMHTNYATVWPDKNKQRQA
jgi:hypothetical protein